MTKLLLFLATFLLTACQAEAQQRQCSRTEKLIEGLQENYGQSRHFIAISKSNMLATLMGNSDSGTWTVFVTDASGLSCVVDSGVGFVVYADPPYVKGEDG